MCMVTYTQLWNAIRSQWTRFSHPTQAQLTRPKPTGVLPRISWGNKYDRHSAQNASRVTELIAWPISRADKSDGPWRESKRIFLSMSSERKAKRNISGRLSPQPSYDGSGRLGGTPVGIKTGYSFDRGTRAWRSRDVTPKTQLLQTMSLRQGVFFHQPGLSLVLRILTRHAGQLKHRLVGVQRAPNQLMPNLLRQGSPTLLLSLQAVPHLKTRRCDPAHICDKGLHLPVHKGLERRA